MLHLYSSYEKFAGDIVLYNNDTVFNVHTAYSDFDEKDLEFMKKYDDAELVDPKNKLEISVRTRYGITSIMNLSTGLKTLLNLRNMKNMNQYKALDITEAGPNVLIDIFNCADELEIPLILQHSTLPSFRYLMICVDDEKFIDSNLKLAQYLRNKEDM